jgi:hypothetical protein
VDEGVQALVENGWSLVGIGQGQLKALKSWGRMNKFPGTLYSDLEQPSLPAYAALGARFKGNPQSCLSTFRQAVLGTLHGLRVVVINGHFDLTSGVAKSNFLVQGGVIAFDGGREVFSQMMGQIDEPLPATALCEALRSGKS